MENKDGALAFDVLIRDSNIDQMLSKDEQRIAQFTQNVESNSESIIGSFDGIGRAVGGIAVGAMLQSWVGDIVTTRGEFQQLEIAFTTMLGSGERASALMGQMLETAAKTPFDLKGIAGGAKQLLAYGESAETVNDTLVRLGNIASGLSLPLNDLVYLYGTTMVQGRLFTQDVRQFMGRGIPLVQELSKMLGKTTEEINQMVTDGKIGFPEVQKVLESLTNSGGMFFNLMEQQSASLTGQIANLGDSWDMMLNDMGQNSNDVLSGGIELATTLVENYGTVLNVLEGLVAMYGTYKVATVTLALAQNKSTGFATIDNIVNKARIGTFTSLNSQIVANTRTTGLLTKEQQAYTAALQTALTVEQQEQVLRNIKINALHQLLSAEQMAHLQLMNLTAGSVEYVAAAESLLTTDQKLSLIKQQLGRDSAAYSVAIAQEIQVNNNLVTSQIAQMRAEGAALKQKQVLLLAEYRTSQNKIQSTRVQIALATANGDAMAVETLKQQQLNQLKAHAVIVTDLKNAKEAQSAITSRIAAATTTQAANAEKAKTVADAMQTTSTNVLGVATSWLTVKLKALWATMVANPLTAIISLVGLAVSAFMMFRSEEEQDIDVSKEFESQTKKQIESLNVLKAVLANTSVGTETHNKALEKLNTVLKSHNLDVIQEGDSVQVVTDKYEQLTKAIRQNTAERLIAQNAERLALKQNKDDEKALEKFKDKLSGIRNAETMAGGTAGTYTTYSIPAWVSGMADEYYQAVYEQVQSRMAELEGLDFGTTAYNNKLKDIQQQALKMIQDATGATDTEIQRADGFMEAFVTNIAKNFEKVRSESEKVKDGLTRMADGLPEHKEVTEEVDLMTLSLEQLHKKASELNGQMVVIGFGNTGYAELEQQLNNINNAIGKKQNSLNTESGISDEIKRLEDLKKTTEIGSDAYNTFVTQINSLRKKLPDNSKGAGDKRLNAAKDVAQKEIELQMQLEESRISLIKDGYERRVAETKLQHQRELARIDKEEKELEAKYREAGKKMPTETKQKFTNMRTNENAGYEVTQAGLLDVEIEERKKAYELYYRWVSAYGTDVANEQYSNLIASGNTYTEWLQGKINALQAKQKEGNISNTEGTQLITLKTELDDVTGVKTEMDKFTESISKAKEQSKSLGEYLAELARKKQDLQQGNTNLIGEDRASAIKEIDRQIAENTEELQRSLLEKYKSNAQLRLEVEKQYDDEIYWLKQNGFAKQAELAEKAKVKAIAEIDATKIQATDTWTSLFDSAQYLSSSAFDEIVKGLRKQVDAIKDADVKKALQKQLNDLEQQTQGNNPFKALVKGIKEYDSAVDKLGKKKALEKLFSGLVGSIDQIKSSFDSVVEGLKDMGMAGDESTQSVLDDVSGLMGGVGDLAAGYASMNPAQMIQGAVGVVTNAISLFDSTSRRIKKEMAEHEKNLKHLQSVYNDITFKVENAVGNEYYTEQLAAIENLKQQTKEYNELARLEQSKKSKDRDDDKVQEYKENAKEAAREIERIQKEIADTLVQTNFKDLASDLADAWADAFGDMEKSAESFDEVWKKTVANAIKNALKMTLIEGEVKKFTDALSEYMKGNNYSASGFNFDYWKQKLKGAGDNFSKALEEFEDYFTDTAEDMLDNDDSLEGNVKSVTEETASKLAGEITNLRIRQAEHLIATRDVHSSMQTANAAIREAIGLLNKIVQNTSYNSSLYEIRDYLKALSSGAESNPLRAKGYNV